MTDRELLQQALDALENNIGLQDTYINFDGVRKIKEAIRARLAQPEQHPDDAAVDQFAAAMKAKMAKQRAKGYSGWDDKAACPTERLQKMLAEHVVKGDPVDVANFAMMLAERGESTAQPEQEPVAWALPRFIYNADGFAIGTDDPELSWGSKRPDGIGASWPLYTAPQPAAQLSVAQCDGGTCGLGGYCDNCPKVQPVLQDIEQYRLQMAAICTAAIGYWTESDDIKPDYDTLALRDVAKLYAKYDALYKKDAQPVPLTHEQIYAIGKKLGMKCRPGTLSEAIVSFARAIEAAHGIKE